MTQEDADFAVCCAVPVDAPGVTIVARPAGRPGEAAAKFSAKYGQSTGVVIFDDVFVPHERVFLAGEYEEGGFLTTSYATHHRHSCIGARAGFGDLLIGAGALMIEANGLDPDRHGHIREAMVELITITEGFFACGVAASVYCTKDPAGSVMPDAVFSNIGKLLLATQDLRHAQARPLRLGRPDRGAAGPGRGPQPGDRSLALGRARPGGPTSRRRSAWRSPRFIEDLTVSHQGGWYSLISLHGGGSPEAMKREIWRNYPVMEKVELVEQPARPRRPRRGAARLEAAGPLLRHRLRGAGPATDAGRRARPRSRPPPSEPAGWIRPPRLPSPTRAFREEGDDQRSIGVGCGRTGALWQSSRSAGRYVSCCPVVDLAIIGRAMRCRSKCLLVARLRPKLKGSNPHRTGRSENTRNLGF